MREFVNFADGFNDAKTDIAGKWLPEGSTLDYIVNELRVGVGASDAYIAGYLSAVFGA